MLAFENEYFYHVFNRGVAKRNIFTNHSDYQRFLDTLYYYQFANPKPSFSQYKRFKVQAFEKNPKIIDVIAYCLMPNHFHMLIRQKDDGGIQHYMRKVLNSYTKYFNTRYRRIGPLFQGEFKAVFVESDEQLLHLSRYIHLNPYVDNIVENLSLFPYSSYLHYIGKGKSPLCTSEPVLGLLKEPSLYKTFVEDHQKYAQELALIKHLTCD